MDELRARIERWFESERIRYAALAKSLGVPTSIMVDVPVGQDAGAKSHSFRIETRSVSLMATFSGLRFRQQLLPASTPDADSLSQDIFNLFGSAARTIYDGGFTVSFENNPIQAIKDTLLADAVWRYTAELSSLDEGDSRASQAAAADVIDFLGRDKVDLVVAVPLQGLILNTGKQVTSAAVLRTPTAEELGMLGPSLDQGPMPFRQTTLMSNTGDNHFFVPSAILEVSESFDKRSRGVGTNSANAS